MRKDVLAGVGVGAALLGGAALIIFARGRPRSPIFAPGNRGRVIRSATIRR